jgi:hypothetical protein
MGVDVADAGPLGHRGDVAVNGPAVEGLTVIADDEVAERLVPLVAR